MTPTKFFFGSAKSLESYCVHGRDPHTKNIHTGGQVDGQTDGNFVACLEF